MFAYSAYPYYSWPIHAIRVFSSWIYSCSLVIFAEECLRIQIHTHKDILKFGKSQENILKSTERERERDLLVACLLVGGICNKQNINHSENWQKRHELNKCGVSSIV